MSPTVIHVAPHPDDEAVGCPGVLLHLLERGWRVVSVITSLGFPDQWERRRAESQEASRRANFVPVYFDPPLAMSREDDLVSAIARVAAELPPLVAEHGATVVVSPSPHDVHHAHETVGRGVQRAMDALPQSIRWWMWGLWGDLPTPNVFFPFGEVDLARMLHVLEAYEGELARNDLRRMLTGRATANAVLGSERVFGFGSPAASSLPYAEVLTEVRRVGDRWMGSEAHHLDAGPLPDDRFDIDLTPWVDAPSVHQRVGWIREVHGESAST
jgi:LmbE family N-acetylglucosaminyl deacetylase